MNFIKKSLPLVVVLVCLTKIAISQEITLASSLALLVSVSAYAFHSYFESKSIDEVASLRTIVMRLSDQIDEIRLEVIAFKPIQDQVARSAEDIKKVISTTHLSNGIYTRTRLKREPA